jgi:mono/diheme cytochrome c family protein
MTTIRAAVMTMALSGIVTCAAALPLLAQGTDAGHASAPRAAKRAPTYTRDIAPILQQRCQECHQPGSIAPMSLLTYEDAKKYAKRIRYKVAARLMPPWHIDRTVGVQQFKNDPSLTDEQIATITEWVDSGTPMGDPKDAPPPITFPDPNRWQLAERFGTPDLVIKSKPYTPSRAGCAPSRSSRRARRTGRSCITSSPTCCRRKKG